MSMATRTLDQHIEITPGVAGGRPRIAGHRITVQDIALWNVRLGRNADEIAAAYDLSLADVHAALAYYYDHRQELDRQIEQDELFVTALRARTPSKLTRKLLEQAAGGGEG